VPVAIVSYSGVLGTQHEIGRDPVERMAPPTVPGAAYRQVRGPLVHEVGLCSDGCNSADRPARHSVASELPQFNVVARLRPSHLGRASIATCHRWTSGDLPLQRPVLPRREHALAGSVRFPI